MWCGRSSAIISPGSTGRSCWSTRSRRSIPARRRSRDLENALADVMRAFRAGRASRLGFDLPPAHRPHPVRRDQGRPSAPYEPRPAGGDPARAHRRKRSRARKGSAPRSTSSRSPRSAPPARLRSGTGGETLDAIIGVPEKGETIGGQAFDGVAEAAVFPGELPADPDAIFAGDALALPEADNDWRFVRFRPPLDPARRAARRTSGSTARCNS